MIEREAGVKVFLVSVGAERDATILVQEPFTLGRS